MKKVKFNNKLGYTTSVIPHSDGNFPIWDKNGKFLNFINKDKVEFI